MSIWLEIHCDIRDESRGNRGCWTHNNDNPAALGCDARAAHSHATLLAKEQGWKRRKFSGGIAWVCPSCLAVLDKGKR